MSTVLSAMSLSPPTVLAVGGTKGTQENPAPPPPEDQPWPTVHPAPIASAADDGAINPGVAAVGLRASSPPYVAPDAPTEVPTLRAEHSKVIAKPDGAFSLTTSKQRLNYQDSDDEWQPIDLSLIAQDSGPYDLAVKANDRVVRFSDVKAETALAQLSLDGTTIGLRAIGYGAAAPRGDGNRLTFPGSGLAGTLFVQPTDTGFEWGVTLDDALRSPVYAFALDSGPLTTSLAPDGVTVLLDTAPGESETVTVGSLGAPDLLDGAGANAAAPGAVSVQLIAPGTKDIPPDIPPGAVEGLGPTETLVVYRVDPVWLADLARKFPVTLDPSACIGGQAAGCDINLASNSFESFIASGVTPVGWTVMRTGYDARTDDGGSFGIMRSLWYFPDVSLPDGAEVTSATVRLQAGFVAGSPDGKSTHMYRITQAWSTSSTWAQMNAAYDSASHLWYQQAVDWGEMWLERNGIPP
ncbi:MAG: hypothetical protein M3O93_05690 [Chloroflexota bacterium]|nr:hypothetical protein [Chloroflexota bacterium]